MTDRDPSYSCHPELVRRDGPLALRVEKILDNASRVNGEPNYSIEKLGRAWDLATMALVDELDVDPQELIDRLERVAERVARGAR